MERSIVIFMTLIFVTGSSVTFAEKAKAYKAKSMASEMESVNGKITNIDAANNLIFLQDPKTKTERVIKLDPKELAGLKKNENVKVKLKKGSDFAQSVTVSKGPSGHMKSKNK